jgi:hypothetical protein
MITHLSQWAIYDHPKDYPNNFVVRKWTAENGVVMPDPDCNLADSLIEARHFIPAGLVRIGSLPGEDPVIVETWI